MDKDMVSTVPPQEVRSTITNHYTYKNSVHNTLPNLDASKTRYLLPFININSLFDKLVMIWLNLR